MSSDPFLEKVAAAIERGVWHTTHVESDTFGPAYTYTTGLWRLFEAPEVVVVGPGSDVGYASVDEIASAMRDGFRPAFKQPYDDFIEGASVEFLRVDESRYEEMFEHAVWYYGHRFNPPMAFPVVQCILPHNATGRFPWEEGYPSYLHDVQPLLGSRV